MNTKQYKQNLLNQLYEPYKQCMACPLSGLGRKNVVFGSGNADAKLIFIGEGPGKDEDIKGLPFVGRSGKLLDKIFKTVGLTRNDVYITNVVKCRPPNNRTPSTAESNTCKNILLFSQIKIISPQILCTLGAAATESLLGAPVKITKIRGTINMFNGTPVIPTLHPAYILRNSKKLPDMIADIKKALEYL